MTSFGVGGGVVVLDGAISGAGEDFAVLDENGANRRLPPRCGGARLGEGAVPGVEIRLFHRHCLNAPRKKFRK